MPPPEPIAIRSRLPFHYGWIMVATGVLTLFACLGVGRFALGMLLPAMGVQLELSYGEMGFISTGNFIGYLIAVLICGRLNSLLGARRLIFFGLLAIGLSLLLVSQADHFIVVLLLYLITGIGTGVANIPIMGLVAHWFAPKYRGRAAGTMIAGNGLGILFSGSLVPYLNVVGGDDGWRMSWLVFGGLIVLISVACIVLIRNNPEELGLKPIGAEDDQHADQQAPLLEPSQQDRRKMLTHLGSLYFLFGFTYSIYLTFIVTTLVQEYDYSESVAGQFWMGIGFLCIFSGPLFGTLSDRLGRRLGLALVFALQTLAYLLAAANFGSIGLFLSMLLFGLVAFSIPPIIAATLGDYMGPYQVATSFGYVTFFFSIGQIIGPTLAGTLAEASGSFSGSYLLSASLTALAVGLALMLRKPSLKPAD
ncbi:MAG: MFS transporter [Halopseudomonas sp.]